MTPAPDSSDALSPLQGREVVLDLASPYLVIGTLTGEDHRYLIVDDADVHDLRDSHTTRELYVLDTRKHGIRANRSRVLVNRADVVSVSALADVLE
jgi:hypothetical protein